MRVAGPVLPAQPLRGERLGRASSLVFLFTCWVLFSAGPVNPKSLLPPPPLPAAPSKRTAPVGCTPPKPGKRPLLGEKPGLLALPAGE